MSYLLIAILSQSFTIAYLFRKDFKKNRQELFLLCIVLIMAIILIMKFAFLMLTENVLYARYSPAITIATPPLLFLYVKSVSSAIPVLKNEIIKHLIPTVLLTIAFVVVGINIAVNKDDSWINPYKKVYDVLFFTINLTYHSFILFIILNKKNHSNPKLIWLKWPVILWIIGVTLLLFSKIINDQQLIRASIIFAMIGFIIFLIKLSKLKQNVVEPKSSNTTDIKSNFTIKPKYEKSSLKDNDLNAILLKLEEYMVNDSPYLDPNFALIDMANDIKISKHNITEVLNTVLNKNFFLFINEYRIKEAKRKMAIKPNEKLNIIAHFSGYKSKTTFIKYFKQIEGITPSEYRKKLSHKDPN
ncbi:helix-turn-helix domain-containing protein [Formosa haliotis]|uniref:helix-turn-helix domain-containing protein n=1 Tax=Formosa haliotis TaxID=1555194 RepID=UPI0009F1E790|nr:helix-turn-helix domain-containing protein [Formosa haliotis]